ncbi:MAG: aldehyde dehydrogenase family protein [Rugosibacter sp.]|nr:aldehyde dehydrogenase family protein [Rugosibacter sp.]
MHIKNKFFVNGEWVTPHATATIDVFNPATDEALGVIPDADAADVNRAVVAARDAQAAWSATLPAVRADFIERICAGLKARTEELTDLIAADIGMPRKMGRRMQVGLPIQILEVCARHAREFSFEERVGNSLVLREPVGVAACITPWNYPLFQIATKLGPALATGCAVVWKPSEVAPLAAFVLADIIQEAGLPPGVFNLITGYGPTAGEALVTHPDVNLISMTGSTRAGARIGALAAERMKRVTLELGGKSAAVVLDDADLEAAVRATVNSCFLNSGQTCLALTRLIVPEARYAEAAKIATEVAARFTVGDPMGDTAKLGPLVSTAQRDLVVGLIRQGIEVGAELLCGGPDRPQGLERGCYVQPTIFGRVAPDSVIAQEEIFGPVLCIITCRDEEEAIAIANGTAYGLSGAVWSSDVARAQKVARRLQTGQVEINGGAFNIEAPFGGYKQSGLGREMGRYGIEEFLQYKSLQLPA